MTAFPPQRTYKAIALSTAQAQTWLSTYLTSCEGTAYLQPDALLTASGPIQSQGMSSVTIHNLKRLQAGLNGKYDVDPPAADAGDDSQTDKQFRGAVVNVDELYALDEEWQSKSEFEREQSVEIGETGERDPSHGGTGRQTSSSKDELNTMDRKARKAAKKERRKQHKAHMQHRDED